MWAFSIKVLCSRAFCFSKTMSSRFQNSFWVRIEVAISLSPTMMLPVGIFGRMWRTREPTMMFFALLGVVVDALEFDRLWRSTELIGCTALLETTELNEGVVGQWKGWPIY
jgi:hypothetical protein